MTALKTPTVPSKVEGLKVEGGKVESGGFAAYRSQTGTGAFRQHLD